MPSRILRGGWRDILPTHHATRKATKRYPTKNRLELVGKRMCTNAEMRTVFDGGYKLYGTPLNRMKNMLGLWRRTAGVKPTGVDGAGGVFSGDPDFKGNSLFNKEKWLPLCQQAPFMISHYCCQVMKKSPIGKYQRANNVKPILATMAEESRMRKQAWIRHGCNAFDAVKQTSQPMSFWTEQDVLQYIVENQIDLASVYGDVVSENKNHQLTMDTDFKGCKLVCTGCQRTGCVFCGFGMHLEKNENYRFVSLKKTHPKQYDYCIGGGEWIDNPDYDPEYDGEPDWMGWVDWNPPKIWVPNQKGLGMGYVFDKCNEIMGKEMWHY